MTIAQEPNARFDLTAVDIDRQINWDALPQGLQELKDAVGAHAALLLARSYGGGNLYVPIQPRPDSPAFRNINQELLLRLSQAFGGMTLNIPKPDAVYRQLKHQAIHEERAQGSSVAALATKYGLSRRRILQILALPATRQTPQKSCNNPRARTHP